MTDDEMILKAQQWIERRGIRCLCCGDTSFSIEKPIQFLTVQRAMVQTVHDLAPMIAVSCQNCGLVSFYSAVVMKLMIDRLGIS